MKTIASSNRHHYVAAINIFLICLIMVISVAGMVGCSPTSQNLEIRTWYDLDAVRNNLAGSYLLANDLDSTSAGYQELASETANGGTGWLPIGTFDNRFAGSFNGQGYEIRELFVNHPNEWYMGLFGYVAKTGIVNDVGVANGTVTGDSYVGCLVGYNEGTVSDSFSSGSASGGESVAGLMQFSHEGMLSNLCSSLSLPRYTRVGGLVGFNEGAVSNSYSTANVTGLYYVGGLVGFNDGPVKDSYSGSGVTGWEDIGGLVGYNMGTVSDSYSNGNVTGGWPVGGLVGQNYGTISDSCSSGSASGKEYVGGLVGWNFGTVTNAYFTGSVTAEDKYVGGLVGANEDTVSNSYSTGSVTGNETVGGLVGGHQVVEGTVSNSFWDIQTSGQAASDGGTGKTTAEMKNIATFSGVGWNIIAVANLSTRNRSYTWNIVDGVTYPFLSWQA